MASNSRCGTPRRMVLRTRVPDDVLGFSVSVLSEVVINCWMTNWGECHPERLRYLPVGKTRGPGKGFAEQEVSCDSIEREERRRGNSRRHSADLGVFSQPR